MIGNHYKSFIFVCFLNSRLLVSIWLLKMWMEWLRSIWVVFRGNWSQNLVNTWYTKSFCPFEEWLQKVVPKAYSQSIGDIIFSTEKETGNASSSFFSPFQHHDNVSQSWAPKDVRRAPRVCRMWEKDPRQVNLIGIFYTFDLGLSSFSFQNARAICASRFYISDFIASFSIFSKFVPFQ